MIGEDLQRLINRLWLVSRQRWVLIAVSVVAATAATTFTGLAAGNQTGAIVVLVIGLAIGAAAIPDSHTALAVEGLVVWHWLASTEDPTTAWVIPMTWCLLVFHTAVALMAVTPVTADVDRAILVRWARRTAIVALGVGAMWALVVAMDERDAAGNTALTVLGLVTLTALVVAARSRVGLARRR
jgi:hypothetical protein